MCKSPVIIIQDKSYFIKARNRDEITNFNDKIESDSVIPSKFNWDKKSAVLKYRPWNLIVRTC